METVLLRYFWKEHWDLNAVWHVECGIVGKNCVSGSFLLNFLIQPSPIIPVTPRALTPHGGCCVLKWPVIFEGKWHHQLKYANCWWDQDAIWNRVFLRLVRCWHQLFSHGFTQFCVTVSKTLHRGDSSHRESCNKGYRGWVRRVWSNKG